MAITDSITTLPSGSMTRVLSNMPLQAHNSCACSQHASSTRSVGRSHCEEVDRFLARLALALPYSGCAPRKGPTQTDSYDQNRQENNREENRQINRSENRNRGPPEMVDPRNRNRYDENSSTNQSTKDVLDRDGHSQIPPSREDESKPRLLSVLRKEGSQEESGDPDSILHNSETAYPTDSRMRQKAREAADKAKGTVKVKAKRKTDDCEKIWTDCGDDVSSLDMWCLVDLVCSYGHDLQIFYEELLLAEISDPTGFYLGGVVLPGTRPTSMQTIRDYATMEVFMAEWHREFRGDFVDVVEVCGGEARVTQFLVRRLHRKGFRRGLNLDLCVGVNLLNPTDLYWVQVYLETCRPIVVIMAPPCRGMKGYVELNRVLNPETSQRSYEESSRIGDFCADVAEFQEAMGHFWFNEQPEGSLLYQRPKWQALANRSTTVSAIFQQCKAGLVAPRTALPVRKSTEAKANTRA